MRELRELSKDAKKKAFLVNDGKTKKKKKRTNPIPLLIFIIGLMIALEPLARTIYANFEARDTINALTSEANAISDGETKRIVDQAISYNAYLAGEPEYAVIPKEDIYEYDDQLRSEVYPAMAWIDIPVCNIKIPINHGDNEDALASGAGHLKDSSLPVGGNSVHSYIEGHSGAQNSIFDSIRKLEPGDVFAIHVLNEVYAYRVKSWEIIKPNDIESKDILPEKGLDQVTLVTCTTEPDAFSPKGRTGINDRRLLVNAERTEYNPAEFGEAEEKAKADVSTYVNEYSWQVLFIVGLALVLVLLGVLKKIRDKKKLKKKNEEIKRENELHGGDKETKKIKKQSGEVRNIWRKKTTGQRFCDNKIEFGKTHSRDF